MQAVPRHLFVDDGLASHAYQDDALPIGFEQTISQPYIVARMIEAVSANQPLLKVLEVGTGCGYQAAVLSQVAQEVYSIERIRGLHELARQRLRPLRLANVRLALGDGMQGLIQAAPYDAIIVAAAGLELPPALLEQLTIGGRLIAPVGILQQSLILVERTAKDIWNKTVLGAVRFVPLQAGIR
jgi:protein-L-isoaspartate(D-aspartate) O-methyltransferase